MILLLVIFLFLLFIALTIFLFFHLITIFTGAPYLGSVDKKIDQIIKFSSVKKGQKSLDIGAGDGRIVIEFAKYGARAYGVELNPFLVLLAKWKIKRTGLSENAFVYWRNFWTEDLSRYDVITVYGIPYMMKKLESKIKKEAKKNAKIISNSYRFPSLKPEKEKDFVYLYIK